MPRHRHGWRGTEIDRDALYWDFAPAHLAAIQVKILQVSVFRDQKTVTIRMGVNSALNQMLTVRKGVVVFL